MNELDNIDSETLKLKIIKIDEWEIKDIDFLENEILEVRWNNCVLQIDEIWNNVIILSRWTWLTVYVKWSIWYNSSIIAKNIYICNLWLAEMILWHNIDIIKTNENQDTTILCSWVLRLSKSKKWKKIKAYRTKEEVEYDSEKVEMGEVCKTFYLDFVNGINENTFEVYSQVIKKIIKDLKKWKYKLEVKEEIKQKVMMLTS